MYQCYSEHHVMPGALMSKSYADYASFAIDAAIRAMRRSKGVTCGSTLISPVGVNSEELGSLSH
eukprot:CAMPEP_0172482636 /NCGR_PEP_ID=MMETSP1066-20121228/9144_1 /TAXON_ID=671091 /ORGANISM="Coscinodiscus wailesii, Strain CCMP2513" /LENGTH=63 /DNA_ID=CAMNT_0013245907 /DNA_START=178 /DNA_END=366 /DNA_ORIENTATION=-